jgi:hypothetical protein
MTCWTGRFFVCAIWLALAGPAIAQREATEPEIKAAFLYRFISFVEWPSARMPPPGAPIIIGVIGAPEVAEELRILVTGRVAQGHSMAVRVLSPDDVPTELHMLFVGRMANARLPALARSAEPGTLIVSDSAGALEQGSMVNFVEADGRIRFAVSVAAAERSGLRISSRMLAVATEVRTGREP